MCPGQRPDPAARASVVFRGTDRLAPWAIGRRHRLPGRAKHQQGEQRERDEEDEEDVAAWNKEEYPCEGDSDGQATHGVSPSIAGGWMCSVIHGRAVCAKDVPRYGELSTNPLGPDSFRNQPLRVIREHSLAQPRVRGWPARRFL
jgi:hypothetical protein